MVIAEKGNVWGVEFLLDSAKNKTLDDDIVMEIDGVIAEINLENFEEAIGGRFDEVIQ